MAPRLWWTGLEGGPDLLICGVKQVGLVIPLRLTRGALDVYQQLRLDGKADVG